MVYLCYFFISMKLVIKQVLKSQDQFVKFGQSLLSVKWMELNMSLRTYYHFIYFRGRFKCREAISEIYHVTIRIKQKHVCFLYTLCYSIQNSSILIFLFDYIPK